MLRTHANAARPRNVGGNDGTQLRESLGRAIVRPAVVQRLFGRLDDMRGSGEVGLADFEMNHLGPARLQGAGTDQHIECGFDSDPRHTLGQLHMDETL